MSESTLGNVQPESQDQNGTGVVEPADTKAPWSDYLEGLPDSVKPLVEPKFKEWDANVTKKFQTVQSEYEPLKPYKEFVDAGVDPAFLAQAIQFVEAFNSDPEKVYKAMQEQYGFGSDQGQGTEPNEPVIDSNGNELDPRFLQLEQNQQLLAEIITAQHEADVAAQEDFALEQEISAAKEKFGEFDDRVVLGFCAANPGMSVEQAAQHYSEIISAELAKRQAPANIPTILGGGGSLPSQSVDPAKLSSKDRKALVAQFLANSANS